MGDEEGEEGEEDGSGSEEPSLVPPISPSNLYKYPAVRSSGSKTLKNILSLWQRPGHVSSQIRELKVAWRRKGFMSYI